MLPSTRICWSVGALSDLAQGVAEFGDVAGPGLVNQAGS